MNYMYIDNLASLILLCTINYTINALKYEFTIIIQDGFRLGITP